MEGSFLFKAFVAFSILLQLITRMNLCSAAGGTNTEFIKTSCRATTYPRLCIASLSSYAGKIQSSPKILVDTALSLSLQTARSTSTAVRLLSKIHGLRPREAAAMSDCVEQLGDSVDELQRSLQETERQGGSNRMFTMDDVLTWVSAALTDDDTCMDGLTEIRANGKLHDMVRRRILHAAQMTTTALALINNYASSRTTTSP